MSDQQSSSSPECNFCGNVGISKVSNHLKTPKYPHHSSKQKKQKKSSLEKDPSDFNLGNDLYMSDPDEAAQLLMRRELSEILVRDVTPHDPIFIPDPFIFGGVASKVLLTTTGQENLPQDQKTQLHKYKPTLEGDEVEYEIYKKLKEVLEKKMKNITVFNGWNVKGIKKAEMREYDFIIVSETLRSIIHIEAKKSRTPNHIESATKQLKSGLDFFSSVVPFDKEDDWTYTRVMCFGESQRNADTSEHVCSKCNLFVITSDDDFQIWWNKISSKLSSHSHQDKISKSYDGILKFLFYQMHIQEDPITETHFIEKTEEKLNEASTIKNIFFWSRVQYELMNKEQLNRIAFTSSFGTGKTFLLKAKAKELLKAKKKVVFVIFSDSKEMLLKQMYEEEFKKMPNAKVFLCSTLNGSKSIIEDLDDLVRNHPNSNFFMDEVDSGVVDAEILIGMSEKVGINHILWIAYQSQTPPSPTALKGVFKLPNMTMPLRYSRNILKTCEAHKANVRGSRWPQNKTFSDSLLNLGVKSLVLFMKPDTSTVHTVLDVVEILQKIVVKTVIKIDFEEKEIIQELSKTSVNDRLVSEDNSKDFIITKKRILVVTSKSDKFVKGIEVPLLVVFSNNPTGELTEDIFSRCTTKLIVVCNEENVSKFILSEKDDFTKIIPVKDTVMPKSLENAIINDKFKEFREPLIVYRKPVSVNIKNKSGQTPLMLICAHGRMEMAEELFHYKESEIDINACDNVGRTALDYAKESGHPRLAEILIKNGASQGEARPQYLDLSPTDKILVTPCDSNQLDFADNWGTGGRGFFKINFPIAVDKGWTASATFSRPITAMRLWDAVNPKCSGSTCTFNNQAWNAKQGKGAFLKLEFSFDFPNGATPQLVSLTINGASVCGGSGPNPGPNPSPPSPTTVAPPSPTSALPPGPMPPTNPPSSGQRGVYVPMPKKVVGLYLAIADESVSGFTTNDNWTPQLFDYQQSGSNLLFFSFVNPLTMVVPKSFANFARTRGTNAAGAIPKNTMIVFAIGGYGYSLGQYNPWPWLSSKAAAESMAEQVAKWPSLYGCDGIDLDIETGAGDVPNSGVNMVFFVRKLRALVPNIYIGQPTFGYPQVVAENDVINESWDAQGNSKNLADTIGLMVYEGTQSLDWVKSYVSGADQGAGFPIKCRAPANTILLGAKGSASSGDIMTMANASVSKGYRGIMVWYASVKNGFGYEASWDTSKYTDSQQGFKNAMNSFNPAG